MNEIISILDTLIESTCDYQANPPPNLTPWVQAGLTAALEKACCDLLLAKSNLMAAQRLLPTKED